MKIRFECEREGLEVTYDITTDDEKACMREYYAMKQQLVEQWDVLVMYEYNYKMGWWDNFDCWEAIQEEE